MSDGAPKKTFSCGADHHISVYAQKRGFDIAGQTYGLDVGMHQQLPVVPDVLQIALFHHHTGFRQRFEQVPHSGLGNRLAYAEIVLVDSGAIAVCAVLHVQPIHHLGIEQLPAPQAHDLVRPPSQTLHRSGLFRYLRLGIHGIAVPERAVPPVRLQVVVVYVFDGDAIGDVVVLVVLQVHLSLIHI